MLTLLAMRRSGLVQMVEVAVLDRSSLHQVAATVVMLPVVVSCMGEHPVREERVLQVGAARTMVVVMAHSSEVGQGNQALRRAVVAPEAADTSIKTLKKREDMGAVLGPAEESSSTTETVHLPAGMALKELPNQRPNRTVAPRGRGATSG